MLFCIKCYTIYYINQLKKKIISNPNPKTQDSDSKPVFKLGFGFGFGFENFLKMDSDSDSDSNWILICDNTKNKHLY